MSQIAEAVYSAAMRAMIFALLLLPTACSEAPDATSSDLERRDTAMAELMDRTTELEKRVKKLEEVTAVLTKAATRPLDKQESSNRISYPVQSIEQNRLERRVNDLEREISKTPPP